MARDWLYKQLLIWSELEKDPMPAGGSQLQHGMIRVHRRPSVALILLVSAALSRNRNGRLPRASSAALPYEALLCE